jgi:hypothetical protein
MTMPNSGAVRISPMAFTRGSSAMVAAADQPLTHA